MDDVKVIGIVWILSLALQILGWSWSKGFFSGLRDRGWAAGRLVSWLVISLMIWVLGHWGLKVNSDWGIGGGVLVLVGLGLKEMVKRKNKKVERKDWWKWIVWEEGLFLLGLVGLSLVRSFEPSIFSLEKFMDYGFIKKYIVSTSLPVEDIWWAGRPINYYSFGHFMASVLVRIWGVGLEKGYNLVLGFILGLSLSLSFSLIINWGKRKKKEEKFLVIGGLVGSLLTCLGGNSYTLWYLLKNRKWEGFWYADATRFIERTIHEFPGYSFVVSDLHAHLLDLPIVLGFLLALIVWLGKKKKRGKYLTEVIMGGLLGIMLMTNTWDVVVYGLLGLVVVGILKTRKSGWEELKRILLIGMRVGAGLLLVGWWWGAYFESIPSGLKWSMEHTSVNQWFILWGGHLLFLILAWWMSKGKEIKEKAFVRGLAVVGVILLLIPEIVYVEDIYTGYPRANTMFKLTYQAFVLMSLAVGWVINEIVRRKKRLFLIMAVILWGGLMVFPFQAYPAYYRDFREYQGLDGLRWMRDEEGDKWGAVMYLEEFGDGRSLLEAAGDSYSRFNSVSAFSGTSSVLGWRVHEWLWRGGYSKVKEREEEVRMVFETGKERESRKIVNKYSVGWIYVGKEEREIYEVDEKKLLKMGKVVWRGKESKLIEFDY